MKNIIADLIPEKSNWHRIKKSDPYSYTLENNGQVLFYFGANHSHDSSNHQYPVLEYFWNRFVESEHTEKVALVEGGLRHLRPTIEESVEKDGECGWVTHHAHEKKIPVVCPEPKDKQEQGRLQTKFTQEEIQLYYFVRLVQVWHRKGQSLSFEEFYNQYYGEKYALFIPKNLPDWSQFDFSVAHMKEVHLQVFGREFDETNLGYYKKVVSHARTDFVTNLVSAECSRYRDIAIVTNIINEWKLGKSIFVCFGLSHAVFQEPALRQILLN